MLSKPIPKLGNSPGTLTAQALTNAMVRERAAVYSL